MIVQNKPCSSIANRDWYKFRTVFENGTYYNGDRQNTFHLEKHIIILEVI